MQALKMAYIKDKPREEWLALRKNGIGGSDAGAILGLSEWGSPLSVYCDKKGITPEREDNEAMRQGRDFEQYVANRFEEATGKLTRRCNFMLQHPQYRFMIADVDRLVIGENAGVECKTTSIMTRTDYDSGDVPPHYYAQCQHYMAVTGMSKWYLAVLILNKGFHVFEIARNESDIAAMIEAERDFWERYILTDIMPAPSGKETDGEIIESMSAGSVDPDAVASLYGLEDASKSLGDVKAEIKRLETEKDRLEQTIKARMGTAGIGRMTGYLVKWPEYVRSGVDTQKLKSDHPDVYQSVLKESTYRRLTIKEVADTI